MKSGVRPKLRVLITKAMIEIIALFFLLRNIGQMAQARNVQPGRWKWAAFGAWVLAEFLGVFVAMSLLGATMENPTPLIIAGLVFAPGGYLLVHKRLADIPLSGSTNQDIEDIGRE